MTAKITSQDYRPDHNVHGALALHVRGPAANDASAGVSASAGTSLVNFPHTDETSFGGDDQSAIHLGSRRRPRDTAVQPAIWVKWLVAAALVANVAMASADGTTATAAQPCSQMPVIGLFTGEFVEGAPLYQLPTVAVVAQRKVELAKLQREERAANAVPTKATSKHPA